MAENVYVSLEEAYERGKQDINFFAALCIPEICLYPFPDFYVAAFHLLLSKPDKLLRFALGLPRGHAKTTFIKILLCYLVVYDKAKFLLIVCSNSALAESLLADIHDILCSDNIKQVYGDWQQGLAIDSAEMKKTQFHGNPILLVARGWQAGIRGLNLKHHRPDVIFCDDAQTKQNSESETDSRKLLRELVGTIFKALAPRGTRLILYVGNMYSETCILNQLRKTYGWYSMITGAILADKQPLWPELHPLEELMESFYHDESLGLSDVWFAEVMNDPVNSSLSILPLPLPFSEYEQDEIENPIGTFITIDPAGFRDNADQNQIIVHAKIGQTAVVVESCSDVTDPENMIIKTLQLALKWRVSIIGIEDVAYQQTLQFWMNHYIRLYDIRDIYVVPLKPHGRRKEERIRLYIQSLYAGHAAIHDPETRRLFTWQASQYKIGRSNNKDDLLDACSYAEDIRSEYWDYVILTTSRLLEAECSVIGNNAPF